MIKFKNLQTRLAWMRAGTTSLLERTQGELSVEETANVILDFFNEWFGAKISAFYLKDPVRPILNYTSGFAFNPTEDKRFIKLGEGITGQAAFSNQILSVKGGEDHIRVSSATGESKSTNILAIPLKSKSNVLGVIELALFKDLQEHEMELIQNNRDTLAGLIASAQSLEKINTLLTEAQQYSEELQSQQEELKLNNEELEQQSRSLKESQSRLEGQQIEIENLHW